MPANPILKTIEKMRAGLTEFFWDAFIALQVNGHLGRLRRVRFVGRQHDSRSRTRHRARMGQKRHLWAFDSFEGFPEITVPRQRWSAWSGHHADGCRGIPRDLRANGIPRYAYTAAAGYFEDTLPPLGTDGAPADIALAYIDCNMYVSTVTVFYFLAPSSSTA